ncbi:S8 family serine peptidase [Actinoplanes sp. NPDC089786]|uniref:S8 family serine peptidase n=1 Tax=Actinoplanes sp. NPDC089786 TaxID=3155185 RepID=UPI00344848F6
MRRRRIPAIVLGVVTIATVPVAYAQSVEPSAAGSLPSVPVSGHSVTLLTGDQITVVNGHTTAIQPGAGRDSMRFVSRQDGDAQYVIPSDALPLVQAGSLDERLFDVNTLIRFGYDDRTAALPLLVAYPGSAARARSAAAVPGARIVRDLPATDMLAVQTDRSTRAQLWQSLTGGTPSHRTLRPGVKKVWLDGKRAIDLDTSVPQIGAPAAWRAGLDGTGVTVAVLDSGVDATHPDLTGKITLAENFTDAPDADDEVGHGTHVASIIAGTGAASEGRYRGVAPGAKLLNGKVCRADGCPDSAILAGMAWAAQRAPVVNMSLGGSDSPGTDPLEAAVEELTQRFGALFVIAAGNGGDDDEPVDSPGSADAALTVGAVDRKDQLAHFSSRGPRIGDGAIKPDITAPGVNIMAAKAAHDDSDASAPVEKYATHSGTSMATPHVAGAAAILTQQHPNWSPHQLKTLLMGASHPTEGLSVFGQGSGRVDLARAITQSVATNQTAVTFDRQTWPHDDDKAVTRTVTYRNDGTTPVTLTLGVTATGPGGAPAPSGVFTLSHHTVTLAAGETSDTTLTADTSINGPDGVYYGFLTATAPGGIRVETPFAVDREGEVYDVTLVHTARDGTSPSGYRYTRLVGLNGAGSFNVFGEPGQSTTTLRVPKGQYGVISSISGDDNSDDPADANTTTLVQPRLVVDGPTTVRLDARLGKPVSIDGPEDDATLSQSWVKAEWTRAGSTVFSLTAQMGPTGSDFVAQIGSEAPYDGFHSVITAQFAQPGDGSFRNSPSMYDTAYSRAGRFFDGFTKRVRNSELATIQETYATEAPGAQGDKTTVAVVHGISVLTLRRYFDLPFRRTAYVNTDGGALWTSTFTQRIRESLTDISVSAQAPTRLRHGIPYHEQWNTAVFAPTVLGPSVGRDYVARTRDTIGIDLPAFGEGSGHPGDSTVDSSRIALYSGDTLIGE